MQWADEQLRDETDEQLKEDMKTGLMTWEPLPPSQKLAGYESETLDADRHLILDLDYLAKRRAGLAPPLLAEQLLAQRTKMETAYQAAVQEQQMQGLPPPPAPELVDAPRMWVLLLQCRDWVFEHYQRDFVRLLHAEERTFERGMTA